jgi:hypothetical protein
LLSRCSARPGRGRGRAGEPYRPVQARPRCGWRCPTGSLRCGCSPQRPACVDRSWPAWTELLDLDARTLAIEDTRGVVAGYTIESDGSPTPGPGDLAGRVHGGTAAGLPCRARRRAGGVRRGLRHEPQQAHALPRRPALHADTITRRFNRLVDLAGVRRIRLHDVRHTYATFSLDSGVHGKIVSDRIGHAQRGSPYRSMRSTGHDRDDAELVAGLIRHRLQGAS